MTASSIDDRVLRAAADSYARDGFYLTPAIIEPELIRRVSDELDEQASAEPFRSLPPTTLRKMDTAQVNFPAIHELCSHPAIGRIAAALTGGSGDYDAAAVASDVFHRMGVRGQIKESDYRIIYRSQKFPTSSFAYAHDLEPKLADKMLTYFYDYRFPPEMQKAFDGADRFFPINYKTHWDVVRQVAKGSGGGFDKATYIYAHAREGMFLPLLKTKGYDQRGLMVEVWTSDDWLYRYQITQVRRDQPYTTGLQDPAKAKSEQLWLQTSQGPGRQYGYTQVLAKPIDARPTDHDAAHPTARPVDCG